MKVIRKFVSSGRIADWFRAWREENPSISLLDPAGRLPTDISKEPKVLRIGLADNDNSPTYNSDESELRIVYHGYCDDHISECFSARLLYEEIVALQPKGMAAISDEAVAIDKITVSISSLPYTVPLLLENHAEKAISYFKESRKLNWSPELGYENNRTARLKEISDDGKNWVLQEARYFDQLATNATIDTDSGCLPKNMRTIRKDLDRPKFGRLPKLEDSVCANTIGVAAMFFTKDWAKPLLRVRNPSMATIPRRGLHPTVTGVYELPENAKRGGEYDFRILEHGIRLEIDNEIHLSEDEYELYPIALARELPRGGKPQLFFAARSLLTLKELEQKARKAKERNEFILTEEHIFNSETASIENIDRFTYEGWASLYFSMQFLRSNEPGYSARPHSSFSG